MSEYDINRNRVCQEKGICTTCHKAYALPKYHSCGLCLTKNKVRKGRVSGQQKIIRRW